MIFFSTTALFIIIFIVIFIFIFIFIFILILITMIVIMKGLCILEKPLYLYSSASAQPAGKGVFSDSNRGFSKQLQLYEKVWVFFATVSTEKGFLQRFSEGFLRRFSE